MSHWVILFDHDLINTLSYHSKYSQCGPKIAKQRCQASLSHIALSSPWSCQTSAPSSPPPTPSSTATCKQIPAAPRTMISCCQTQCSSSQEMIVIWFENRSQCFFFNFGFGSDLHPGRTFLPVQCHEPCSKGDQHGALRSIANCKLHCDQKHKLTITWLKNKSKCCVHK